LVARERPASQLRDWGGVSAIDKRGAMTRSARCPASSGLSHRRRSEAAGKRLKGRGPLCSWGARWTASRVPKLPVGEASCHRVLRRCPVRLPGLRVHLPSARRQYHGRPTSAWTRWARGSSRPRSPSTRSPAVRGPDEGRSRKAPRRGWSSGIRDTALDLSSWARAVAAGPIPRWQVRINGIGEKQAGVACRQVG